MTSLLLPVGSTKAQTAVTDYQGNWKVFQYNTPSRWVEGYYNNLTQQVRNSFDQKGFAGENEILVDIYYPESQTTGAADIAVASSGNISGGFSGTSAISNGRLVTNVDDAFQTFFPAPNLGFLVGVIHDSDTQYMNVLVKKQGIPAGSELAGNWSVVGYSTPAKLQETFYSNNSQSNRIGADDQDFAQQGEQLVDLNYSEAPEVFSATLTFSSGGSVSGDESGSFVINGTSGEISLAISGDNTYPLMATPNRELLMGVFQDELVQDFNVLVKQGSNPTLSEVAGSWRVCVFTAPTQIMKNGALLDAYLSGDYNARHLAMRISTDGSASVGGEAATVSVSGPSVNLNVDGQTYSLKPTISRDIMAGVFTDGNEQELIILVREPRLDVELSSTNLNITWGGMANALLQSSDNLSSWDDEGTLTPNGTVSKSTSGGTVKFYRVVAPAQ